MPKPHYLRFAATALLWAALVFLVLPFVLRLLDPEAGGFDVGTLNALALGAVLLYGVLHLGYFAYSRLFPRFREYLGEGLEQEGRLFDNLTTELRTPLYDESNIYPNRLAQLIERRKVAQFQFLIRCVRLFFCLLVLGYLLWLVQHMLTVAMTVVPGSSPSI